MTPAGRIAEPGSHPGFRFGVGFRRRHYEPLLAEPPLPGLDFFEVLPENFLEFGGLPRRALAEARARVPVVTHGVSMNLGGPDEPDEGYLDALRALLDELDVPWHSDHVSVSGAHGVEYHDLLPLPLTHAGLERMAARVRHAAARLGRPMLVENPTVYTVLPGDEMSEPAFLAGLVEASGCRLLLDLNNVWVNCRNHGGDPVAYLEALPPGCVGQYHLAGHREGDALVIDSHGAPVCDEVRELYRYALRRLGPAWTLLERDAEVPALDELLDELGELRGAATQALQAPEVTVSLPALGPGPGRVPGDAAAGAAALHAVVIGDREPEAVAATLGVPEEGLRLYRNFFRRHHRDILATPYRVLFSLLDDAVAAELARGFQAAHPMAHREINRNAAPFPGWLGEQVAAGAAPAGITEFHVELATLERARFEAYANPCEAEAPEGSAGPALNPTLAVLQLGYPVGDYVDAWSAALRAGEPAPAAPEAPATEPEVLLVYRDPATLQGRITRGTPRLLFVLKMLHEGLDPAEAGRRAGRDEAFAVEALEVAAEKGVALT